jgi:hypothetical protein
MSRPTFLGCCGNAEQVFGQTQSFVSDVAGSRGLTVKIFSLFRATEVMRIYVRNCVCRGPTPNTPPAQAIHSQFNSVSSLQPPAGTNSVSPI